MHDADHQPSAATNATALGPSGYGARLAVARQVASRYAGIPEVEAIALSGSLTAGAADRSSDLDLYIYSRRPVARPARAAIAHDDLDAEIDNRFWEPDDQWIEVGSGLAIDVTYRDIRWIEDDLERVLVRHEAQLGYTTCIWHNVLTSRALFDRTGWFHALQARPRQPFPEPLRNAIVAKNHPVLVRIRSSYRHQLEKAVERADLVSVNHRVTALLASYFDILFAVNRVPHPGEKRLLWYAERCPVTPSGMRAQVEALLHAAGGGGADVLKCTDMLVAALDDLLRREDLIRV